jgi:hypothetical protein
MRFTVAPVATPNSRYSPRLAALLTGKAKQSESVRQYLSVQHPRSYILGSGVDRQSLALTRNIEQLRLALPPDGMLDNIGDNCPEPGAQCPPNPG